MSVPDPVVQEAIRWLRFSAEDLNVAAEFKRREIFPGQGMLRTDNRNRAIGESDRAPAKR